MISNLTPISGTEIPQNSVESAIKITGMNKWYGAFHALKDINLTVATGDRPAVSQ
ncbi:MAG: hypothetical protein P1U83_11520 [Roseovarius sp.]|nr:hypothetical protein [Roseovarius sp.]